MPPTVFPLTETTTSPACMPPARAGLVTPESGVNPAIWVWLLLATPTKASSPHRSRKAMMKCMADPATATRSRYRNGWLR